MESLAGDLKEMVRTPLLDSHVAELRRRGRIQHFAKGQIVAEVGDPMDTFIYILEGSIEVLDSYTREAALPYALGPTQFVGEIAFLIGGAYSVPMRAREETTAIAVPHAQMLEAMTAIPEMSDIVITVFAARRRRQVEEGVSALTLVGVDQSRDVRAVAAFLSRNKIPFNLIEDGSEDAKKAEQICGVSMDQPRVIFGKEQVVDNPTPAKVARLLGLELKLAKDEVVDVLIVGGGPAGVAAAVYAGAEGLSAVVVEDMAVGGQAGTSSRIENYLGFPTGISGADLVWRGEVQAMKFGTRFATPRCATGLAMQPDDTFRVTLDNEQDICSRSIVVATGVQYRRLPLERLERFEGSGIYYAATEMEARYCKDAEVVVVGGGNSAGQAAMFLSRMAKHVHVLIRGDSLAASMSDYLSSRLEANPNVTIRYGTQIAELHGDAALQRVTLDTPDGDREIECPAAFIMVGAAPNTGWLADHCKLDQRGFVVTGSNGASPYATSCAGIFAVGDVRAGSVKRVASAVGEGSVVISAVWEHLNTDA